MLGVWVRGWVHPLAVSLSRACSLSLPLSLSLSFSFAGERARSFCLSFSLFLSCADFLSLSLFADSKDDLQGTLCAASVRRTCPVLSRDPSLLTTHQRRTESLPVHVMMKQSTNVPVMMKQGTHVHVMIKVWKDRPMVPDLDGGVVRRRQPVGRSMVSSVNSPTSKKWHL